MLKQSHQSELYAQQKQFEEEYTAMANRFSNRIEMEHQRKSSPEGLSIAAGELAELREMIFSLKRAVQEKKKENEHLRRASLEMQQQQHVRQIEKGGARIQVQAVQAKGYANRQHSAEQQRIRSTTPPLTKERFFSVSHHQDEDDQQQQAVPASATPPLASEPRVATAERVTSPLQALVTYHL